MLTATADVDRLITLLRSTSHTFVISSRWPGTNICSWESQKALLRTRSSSLGSTSPNSRR